MSYERLEKTVVHGCGGAGVSIVARYISCLEKDDLYNLETRFLDTSRADASRFDVDEEKLHILSTSKVNGQIDGSGGRRDKNAVEISKNIGNYVDEYEYKQGELHIIISSASGGSGSVLGPLLATKLRLLNIPVIYIAITDVTSIKYAEYSLNTIKHIELAGRKYGHRIPTVLVSNGGDVRKVDNKIAATVKMLITMNSGSVKSIDTMDTKLFSEVGYDDSLPGGMYSLTVCSGEIQDEIAKEHIITMRVLSDTENVELGDLSIGQYKIGMLDAKIGKQLIDEKYISPISFMITHNLNMDKMGDIETKLENMKKSIAKRRVPIAETSGDLDGIEL